MKFRHQLIFAAIVSVLLLATPRSFARLSMDASIGFDGAVKSQSWAPVLVELFNDGPSVEGLVEVSSRMPSRAVAYCKPVVLPTNSRKRLWLYPHVGNYGQQYDVRLVALNGRLIAETAAPFKILPPNSLLFASATRTEMNLLPLGQRGSEAVPVVAARMRQVALPDDAAGFEGLEALVLTDATESEWTIGQRQAIRNWVALGGRLVVSVNNADNFIHSRFWEELLPLRVTASVVAPDLSGLEKMNLGAAATARQETPVAVGELQRGTIRARAGDIPLVVEAPFGRGTVTMLTFSIEREPFRSWSSSSKDAFWRSLMPLPAPSANAPNAQLTSQPNYQPWGVATVDDIFRGMLETRLERQISLWWLLALIGCYLLVIGPFDYWFVRYKLKRPVLTWVTFPSYVIGFSALIYGIGYALKSGDSEFLQVSFVDTVPEANLVRGTTVAGFYSTSNRRYEFQGSTPESHFRLFSSGYEDSSVSPVLGGETRVIETDQGYVTAVPVPIWSSKMFIGQWVTPDRMLSLTGERIGSGIRLRLHNELPTELTEIRVIADRYVQPLPDLAPNASEERLLTVAHQQGFNQWLTQGYGPLLTQFQNWGMPFNRHDPKDLPPWSTTLAHLSFVEELRETNPDTRLSTWPGLDLSRCADRGDVIVLAYADDFPVAGLQPGFKPDRTQHHALIRCVLHPSTLNPER